MKRLLLLLTILLFFLFLGLGCKTKVEDEVTPCGKRDISYQADIKPIISRNCSACHHEYLLYDSLNAVCVSGEFSKYVIVKQTMPPSGMDSCDLITLKRWYYNGHTPY